MCNSRTGLKILVNALPKHIIIKLNIMKYTRKGESPRGREGGGKIHLKVEKEFGALPNSSWIYLKTNTLWTLILPNHIRIITVVLTFTHTVLVCQVYTPATQLELKTISSTILSHFLNNFIFLSKELRGRAVLDWVSAIHLGALQHLDAAVALAAGEGHGHGEEIIRISSY